jgi:hypothetical protein
MKFKPGDKLVRINYGWNSICMGDVVTFVGLHSNSSVYINIKLLDGKIIELSNPYNYRKLIDLKKETVLGKLP